MHEWKLIAASLHRSSYQAFPGHGSARFSLSISFCQKLLLEVLTIAVGMHLEQFLKWSI